MIVNYTHAAEADLETIGDYIALDSPRRAYTFTRELRAATDAISQYPEAFPVIAKYAQYGFRKRPYRNYLLFYTIDDDKIVIERILNAAQDYETILFPEE